MCPPAGFEPRALQEVPEFQCDQVTINHFQACSFFFCFHSNAGPLMTSLGQFLPGKYTAVSPQAVVEPWALREVPGF